MDILINVETWNRNDNECHCDVRRSLFFSFYWTCGPAVLPSFPCFKRPSPSWRACLGVKAKEDVVSHSNALLVLKCIQWQNFVLRQKNAFARFPDFRLCFLLS